MNDQYPRGKLSNDDEGALEMRLGVQDKTVVISFGKPVEWIGMSGDEAAEFAAALLQRAREAGLSKPVTFVLP